MCCLVFWMRDTTHVSFLYLWYLVTYPTLDAHQTPPSPFNIPFVFLHFFSIERDCVGFIYMVFDVVFLCFSELLFSIPIVSVSSGLVLLSSPRLFNGPAESKMHGQRFIRARCTCLVPGRFCVAVRWGRGGFLRRGRRGGGWRRCGGRGRSLSHSNPA